MKSHTPPSDRGIIVVKVGTSSLTELKNGSEIPRLDQKAFRRIGSQILQLHEKSDLVIVTSGAIAAGMGKCGQSRRPNPETEMLELQRLASIGNIDLLNAWQRALKPCLVGGLLLTRPNLQEGRNESSSAINTIQTLLRNRDVPVINENDAIAVEEIKFGDNDTLSAVVAAQLKRSAPDTAVRLVLLSDVDGLYTRLGDPTSRIPAVGDLEAVKHLAEGADTENGTGGMHTKLFAAEIAMDAGVHMWIASGQKDNGIIAALEGTTGTHFVPMAA